MTQPTAAELRQALDVIERAAGAKKRFSRKELDEMTPQAVADALNENPAAFDKIEEAQS